MASGSWPHPVRWPQLFAGGSRVSTSRDQKDTPGRGTNVAVHLSKEHAVLQALVPRRSVMKHAFTHGESRLTRPLRRLTVLATLSALLLAGCAGGGSASTSSVGRASSGAAT